MNFEEAREKEAIEHITETEDQRRKKITYKIIAKEIGKSEATIKWMKKNNPRLLELIIKGLLYEDVLRGDYIF